MLAGKVPLAISANRESDLQQAIKLGAEYSLRVVILGGAEAWRRSALAAVRRVPGF